MKPLITEVAVVVGRFQVDELHEGHRFLLNYAQAVSDKLIIVLGNGPLPTSAHKPLPFETRAAIIKESYPNTTIVKLDDHRDDVVWSKNLDNLIHDSLGNANGALVALYHSRDSFRDHYSGTFPVRDIPEADLGISGTLRRQRIANNPEDGSEFARGVIWANENKFPTVYSTVDVAVTNETNLLVIQKNAAGSALLFPGGFADPSSNSDEEDAVREVEEETGLVVNIDQVKYLASMNIDDWRYRKERDTLRTKLFHVPYLGTSLPQAGDDADDAFWVQLDIIEEDDFHPSHRQLFRTFMEDLVK